ncbi:glycerophosphodiester phosphodiesterase family protein [Aeromicrobium sp.]|uniref:glycerophosphodiester phosphodiesterase family protein n=1 Tax=Aeromicrobium sp. TaxID=1871063 RepID=UPI0028AE12AF|nr:glycerophosphodiester phosphodiesterase family protein [Aeromicrobium sp.]
MTSVPIVIAHRGVPGSRLEHTRPSYMLGIAEGADYIEPDVVATRDGVLVVRHENEIGGTTDVAGHPEFAHLHTTKFIDGVALNGWFTEDFTLAELKTLRTLERLPQLRPQNLPLGGTEPILTLDEVIDIAEAENARRGPGAEPLGLYVETKHPTYFRSIGHDLNDLLIEVLERRGLNHAGAKVFIQSMETANLRALRDRTPLPLVQLMERKGAPYDLAATYDPRDYPALTAPAELARIAEYAQGIGPNKSLVIARAPDHTLLDESGLVHDAHEAGLLVHIWTMRDENNFLPKQMRVGEDKADPGDATAELLAFFAAGVDGVFSDFTRTAVAARAAHLSSAGSTGPAESPRA